MCFFYCYCINLKTKPSNNKKKRTIYFFTKKMKDFWLDVTKFSTFIIINIFDIFCICLPLYFFSISSAISYINYMKCLTGGTILGITFLNILMTDYTDIDTYFPVSMFIFLNTFLAMSFFEAYVYNHKIMLVNEKNLLAQKNNIRAIKIAQEKTIQQMIEEEIRLINEPKRKKEDDHNIEMKDKKKENDEEQIEDIKEQERQKEIFSLENFSKDVYLKVMFIIVCIESFFSFCVVGFQDDKNIILTLMIVMLCSDWGECIYLGILLQNRYEFQNKKIIQLLLLLIASNLFGFFVGIIIYELIPEARVYLSKIFLVCLGGMLFYIATNNIIFKDIFSRDNTRKMFFIKMFLILFGLLISFLLKMIF